MRNLRGVVGYLHVFLEEILPALALLFMTGLVFVAIVSRYVFEHPLAFMNETVVLLTVWVVWLGAAGAVGKGMHVGVDMLLRQLTGRPQALLDLVISIVVFVTLAVLVWVGWSFALNTGLQLQVLGVSKTVMWLALPVGAALTGIRFAERAVLAVGGVRSGNYELPRQFEPDDADGRAAEPGWADPSTPDERRLTGGL